MKSPDSAPQRLDTGLSLRPITAAAPSARQVTEGMVAVDRALQRFGAIFGPSSRREENGELLLPQICAPSSRYLQNFSHHVSSLRYEIASIEWSCCARPLNFQGATVETVSCVGPGWIERTLPVNIDDRGPR